MLSHQQFRSGVGGCRWGSGQAGGVARSTVVGRLMVANSARLRAIAEQEDEEAVFSVSSGLQVKARRNRAAMASQLPRDPASPVVNGTVDLQDVGDGAHAAALRDATATASTSGSDTPLRALKQRKFLRSNGAAAPPQKLLQHEEHRFKVAGAPASGSPTEQDLAKQGQQATAAAGPRPQLLPPPQPPVHPLPPGMTPERDREIHSELRGCEDWRDVLDVVADEAASLSVRTAVQALTRLNTLTRGSVAARRELTGHPAFQKLKEVLFAQVSLMNNVQLSNSLQAFAQLQVRLSEPLLAGYGEAAVARVDTFYPRDIATLLAAAAAMQWSPPRELLDAMGFCAMRFLSSGEFDARSLPTLLHSAALLGYHNPLLAEAAAQRLAAPGVMPSLAPQGVANSLWALSRLQTYHPPAVAAALAVFSSAPLSYKPQEVANLLWSLTAFRHHPEGAFVLFARSLLSRAAEARPADLATLLYGLALFNVSPGDRVMEKLESAALALLGPETTAAADDGSAGAAASRPRLCVIELANMYWGLALLGAVEGRLFGRLERELAAAWEREGSEIPEGLLRLVFQGFLAARLEAPRRAHSFPPLALDALKRAWTAHVVEESMRRGRGRRVDQVAAILDSLKVAYDKRRPTIDGLGVIDIALKAGQDRYIALQVIDRVDRCANSKQLLGPVVTYGQVLEKNGWEVRYLRISDLDSLAPDMQTRFLEELLRGMGVKGKRRAAAAPAADGPSSAASASDAAAAAGDSRPARRAAAPRGSAAADGKDAGSAAAGGGSMAARSSSSSSPASPRTLKVRSRR